MRGTCLIYVRSQIRKARLQNVYVPNKIGGTIWVRYSLENILAAPVTELFTMYNIGFGVMIDVAM